MFYKVIQKSSSEEVNTIVWDGEAEIGIDTGVYVLVPYSISTPAQPKKDYKAERIAAYPPIGDQLDALFHAGVFPAEMAAIIQAVKIKYPKA